MFEFDINKSKANKEKHGIDFKEAQRLWDDPYYVLLTCIQELDDEKRWLFIGRINEKTWSAIVTYRNANIRIISVRRSRRKEIDIYESS